MRPVTLLIGLVALSAPMAFAGDPPPKAPIGDEIEGRIDAALAAPPTERTAHVRRLAADAHAAIARLLERLSGSAVAARPATSRGVELNIRFLRADEGAMRRLVGGTGRHALGRRLDPEQVQRVLERAESGPDVEQIRGAVLSVFDGQRATVDVVERLSYIADYEVDMATNVADPIVSAVTEGVALNVRPTVDAAGHHVLLEVDLAVTSFPQPFEIEKISLGETTVEIQRPEAHTVRVTRTLTLPVGGHALFGVPRLPGADPSRGPDWVMATAKVVDLPATAHLAPEILVPEHEGQEPPELPPPGAR